MSSVEEQPSKNTDPPTPSSEEQVDDKGPSVNDVPVDKSTPDRIGNPFTLHHINQALCKKVIPLLMSQSPHMIPMRWRDPELLAREEMVVDPAIVRQLSSGFLQRFLPSLERSKSSISEILSNQAVLMDTMEQENAKFKDCIAYTDLCQTMAKAKAYHNKLLNIKRDMANLHDKAAKIKRRALKLQQQKQKEELQKAHQQERELEKEQMLTARVASSETS